MKDFSLNTENNETWLTPPYIIKALGTFDLGPCSPIDRHWDTALKHYTRLDNGLTKPWHGRVWLNPPYGRKTFVWVERLAKHGNGVCLIFARTESKGFHTHLWNKADGILFFEGRIKFYRHDGTLAGSANAASCLVAYGKENLLALTFAAKNKIKGKLITLS